MTETYHWGFDAGWTALGLCVLDSARNVVFNAAVNPSLKGFSKTLDDMPFEQFPPATVVIERYVAYGGITSKYSEYILMMIGAIVDRSRGGEQFFFRAIEWKTALAKREFVKSGFRNPSTKMDKKFSKALATHLTGVKFKTDHEADAACLAYIGTLKDYVKKSAPFEAAS